MTMLFEFWSPFEIEQVQTFKEAGGEGVIDGGPIVCFSEQGGIFKENWCISYQSVAPILQMVVGDISWEGCKSTTN